MTENEHAEVVVVGAGALGVLTAWHLLDAGVSDVLLLERDDIAEGTSAAGAGFVGLWAGSKSDEWEDDLAIERYAIDFYRALSERSDSFEFESNGLLWLSLEEPGWQEHLRAKVNHPGVPERRVVGGTEVAEITSSLVDPAAVHRGIFDPVGAQLNAQLSVAAVVADFERRGGRVVTRRPLTGLIVPNGTARGVQTTLGAISADTVVLACGAWTNALLAQVGAFAPMVTLPTSRLVSGDVGAPRQIPGMLIPELSGLWLRQGGGRLVWGGAYEVPPRRMLVRSADAPARLDQMPIDGLLAERAIGERAAAVVPLLSSCTTVTGAFGAPCYTPDGMGLVGQVPGVEGLLMVGGCNEAGITHGPGYAKLTAALVTGSRPEVNADTYAPDRFAGRFGDVDDVLDAVDARHRS